MIFVGSGSLDDCSWVCLASMIFLREVGNILGLFQGQIYHFQAKQVVELNLVLLLGVGCAKTLNYCVMRATSDKIDLNLVSHAMPDPHNLHLGVGCAKTLNY